MLDTDVVAAALLAEEARAEEAIRVLAASHELLMPSHWKAELANVIWKAALGGRLDYDHIDELITVAEAIPIASVDVAQLWRGAVMRAIAARHPVYDTLFVELAAREETVVVTFDRTLRDRFPQETRAPRDVARRT